MLYVIADDELMGKNVERLSRLFGGKPLPIRVLRDGERIPIEKKRTNAKTVVVAPDDQIRLMLGTLTKTDCRGVKVPCGALYAIDLDQFAHGWPDMNINGWIRGHYED